MLFDSAGFAGLTVLRDDVGGIFPLFFLYRLLSRSLTSFEVLLVVPVCVLKFELIYSTAAHFCTLVLNRIRVIYKKKKKNITILAAGWSR